MIRPPLDWPSALHDLLDERPELAGIGLAVVAEMVTG